MVLYADVPLADPGNLLPVVGFLERVGVPYASDLEAVHLPLETLEYGHGKISKLQMYDVLERWRLRTSEDFGYRVGSHFTPSRMGGVGRVMQESPTLAVAVQRFEELLRDWVSDNTIRVERAGDRAYLRLATRDGLQVDRRVANQITIHALVNIIRLAAGSDWSPRRVWVEVAPHRFHEGTDLLWGAEVTFDALDSAVEFPARFLALRPDKGGPPTRAPLPSPAAAKVADRLRQVVEACMGSVGSPGPRVLGPPSLAEAAQIVGTSPRTLQRRLFEDGADYRRIVADARFDRARELLATESVPSAELADQLGYGSKSAFLRAFRQYTGMTPTEFRRSMVG